MLKKTVTSVCVLFFLFPLFAQYRKIVHYTLSSGLPSATVYQSLQDKDGFIWIATDGGLSRFDGQNFTNFSVHDGLPDNTILQIGFFDNATKIAINCFNKSFCYYDLNLRRIINCTGDYRFKYDVNEVISKAYIYSNKIFPYRINKSQQFQNSVYCSTENGVYILNSSGKIIDSLLQGVSIADVKKDRDGNLWYSSNSEGLFCEIKTNSIVYDQKSGLSSDHSESLYADISGSNISVTIGNSDGKIDILHRNKISGTVLRTDLISGSLYIGENNRKRKYFRVREIHKNREGNFFAVTDQGLFSATGKMPQFYLPLPDTFLCTKSFSESKSGKYWALGLSEHIKIFDVKSRKILYRIPKRCTSIFIDSRDKCWFGSTDGLHCISRPDICEFSTYGSDNKILSNTISDITESRDGIIWAASASYGIAAILPNGIIKTISEGDGLASNTVRRIFIDSIRNKVWVATQRGLNKYGYHMIGKSFFVFNEAVYTTAEGLASNDVNDIIVHHDTVYAATAKGLCVFRDHFHQKKIALIVTDVQINNESFLPAKKYDLTYDKNDISVKFSGICYTCDGKVNYAYRLVGSETDFGWKSTTETSLRFLGLKPDDYFLQLKAFDGDIVSLNFNIKPPFWKRAWFYIVSASTFLFLILLFYRKRVALIQKRSDEKAASSNQVLKLEQDALRHQMNPHFIFNSLNSIQHYVVQNDIPNANKYLTGFASLMRYTLENSAFSSINLENEIRYLSEYLSLEQMRFESKFVFRISCAGELDTGNIELPPMIVQPFVENAIKHGLCYLKEKPGFLHVRFYSENNFLVCQVEDNGIGREASLENKGEFLNKHHSYGINLSEQRLNLANKLKNTDYRIRITDKYDDFKQASGTLITIYFPEKI